MNFVLICDVDLFLSSGENFLEFFGCLESDLDGFYFLAGKSSSLDLFRDCRDYGCAIAFPTGV